MEQGHVIKVDDITKDEKSKSKIVKTVFNGIEKEFEITPYMEDLAHSLVDDLYVYLEKGKDAELNKSDINHLYSYDMLIQIYNWLLTEIDYLNSQGYSKKYIVEQIIYSDEWVEKVYKENNNLVDGFEMYLPVGVFYSICCVLLNRIL